MRDDRDHPTVVLNQSRRTRPLVDSAPADPVDDRSPHVPGYDVLGVLGEGGMGVVYKARQQALGRVVALKMIRPEVEGDTELLARFQGEAAAVARLDHPNIVRVYEVGRSDGRPYLALEYIDGPTLETWIDGRPHDPATVAAMGDQLAQALDHAHRQGVVHRDLKPANVLLDGRLRPHVTDFGIARCLEVAPAIFTRHDEVLGTPAYMSPEQAGQRPVGPASDVYGLGVILYEMLTGRPPFVAPTGLETLKLVENAEPVPIRRLQPAVPRDLETVVLKCLRKEPAHRYASAADLADDLGRFLRGEPIAARPVSAIDRLRRWCRRNQLLTGLTAALGLALVGLFVQGVVWWRSAEEHRVADARQAERAYQERRRLEQNLGEALAAVQAALEKEDLPGAREALVRAEGILHREADGPDGEDRPVFAERVGRLRQAVRLASDLEAVRAKLGQARGGYFDFQGRDEEYAALLAPLGVTLGRPLDDGWIHPLRRSPVCWKVIRSLDLWAQVRAHLNDPAGRDWLLGLNNRLDADVWCRAARDELLGGDADALVARSRQARGERHVRQHWRLLGSLLHLARQGEEAKRLYRVGLLHYPDDFVLANSLGLLLMDERTPDAWREALGCFRAALAIRPNSAGVQLNAGVMHSNLGQYADALAAYQRAVEIQPDYATAHYNTGRMFAKLDRLDEAIAAHRRAIDLGLHEVTPHYCLVALHARQGDVAAVDDRLDTIARDGLYHHTAAQTLVGELHDRGLIELAVRVRDRFLALAPDRADLYYDQGTALMDLGRLDEAVACLRRAHELRPDDAEALCNLGHALVERGLFAEGAETLCRGHALGSQRPGWRYPSDRWTAAAYELVTMAGRVEATPAEELLDRLDPRGLAMLGRVAAIRQADRLATTAYLRALEKQSATPQPLDRCHRWYAARVALRTGLGLGSDPPPPEERKHYRTVAVRLIEAELAMIEGWLNQNRQEVTRHALNHLTACLGDGKVGDLRRATSAEALAEADRAAWRTLFRQAESLAERARQAPTTAPGG